METQTTPVKSANYWWSPSYDEWLASQQIPVHSGLYVEDVQTVERSWWDLRGCPGVVLRLTGHEGIICAYVLEVPPGQTIPAFKMAVEEVIYVLEGRGLAAVWAEGHHKISFEWQKHSLFRVPSNHYYDLGNARGDQPALTLHVSYLPFAMAALPNPDFIFKNPHVDTAELYDDEGFYAGSRASRAVREEHWRGNRRSVSEAWYGNFFPDLTVWDKLSATGEGGVSRDGARMYYSGGITFPRSAVRVGLMALPSRRYVPAHRHGPGVTIVGIQEAEGFVVMWPEGGEKVLCPWKEGSVFVPPNMWYHEHVNTSGVENRQLRIFPPRLVMNYTVPDSKQVVPLFEEDPWIRQRFEEELAKKGLTSLMPPEAYTDPDFEWNPAWLKD